MKLWTENICGNLHAAADRINKGIYPLNAEHLFSLSSPSGSNSIAVFRIPTTQYLRLEAEQEERLNA